MHRRAHEKPNKRTTLTFLDLVLRLSEILCGRSQDRTGRAGGAENPAQPCLACDRLWWPNYNKKRKFINKHEVNVRTSVLEPFTHSVPRMFTSPRTIPPKSRGGDEKKQCISNFEKCEISELLDFGIGFSRKKIFQYDVILKSIIIFEKIKIFNIDIYHR